MKVPADITDAFVTGPSLVEVGGSGSLDSITFAVKDLFDVRGYRTGAGNPSWLEHAPIAQHHALSVERLLSSGATLLGSTITDELAFSLSGTNVHYGTPLNYNAPGRIPGGSSAGIRYVCTGLIVQTNSNTKSRLEIAWYIRYTRSEPTI